MVYKHCGVHVLNIKNFLVVNTVTGDRMTFGKKRSWTKAKQVMPIKKDLTDDELLSNFYITASDDEESDSSSSDEQKET